MHEKEAVFVVLEAAKGSAQFPPVPPLIGSVEVGIDTVTTAMSGLDQRI